MPVVTYVQELSVAKHDEKEVNGIILVIHTRGQLTELICRIRDVEEDPVDKAHKDHEQ